jgi:hypothetical protein
MNESRNPEQIERELEETRTNVDKTINALQEKVSPGQMIDETLGYLSKGSEGPKEYFANLGDTLKENPVPTALIAMGIGWLFVSGSNSRSRNYEGHYRQPTDPYPYDELASDQLYIPPEARYSSTTSQGNGGVRIREKMRGQGAKMGQRTGRAKESVRHGMQRSATSTRDGVHRGAAGVRSGAASARDKMHSSAVNVKNSVRSGAAEVKHRIGETMENVRESLHHRGERTRYRMRDMSNGARRRAQGVGRNGQYRLRQAQGGYQRLLDEQPLVLGALGLAAGLALGYALPATRREDELLGGTRDQLMYKAKETGQAYGEKAQRVAQSAMDGAKQEADNQNLTQQGGREAVNRMQSKVESVAESAKTAAKEEAQAQNAGYSSSSTSQTPSGTPV